MTESSFIRLTVTPEWEGRRLDTFISCSVPAISRTQAQKYIDLGNVVPGSPSKPLKASLALVAGQIIEVNIPEVEKSGLVAQDIPLDVVFEDKDILVIHKPVGMVVHPGAGNPDGTLVNAILAHCPDIDGIGGKKRPGLVHRLDKDTSGLLVIAKTGTAYRGLSRQINRREMSREYVGLVKGELEGSGTVDAPIGRDPRDRQRMHVLPEAGKLAVTHFTALQTTHEASFLHFKLETGRTHQIRVHMKFIHHPMLGDAVYGGDSPLADRQMLHAFRLTFMHPVEKKEMSFTAPPPPDFLCCLEALGFKEPEWDDIRWKNPEGSFVEAE
jgi:23S rRNA pseudouridine1911/1915/1917 synthase